MQITHRFTFGPDHRLPDGTPTGHLGYVEVTAPEGTDHRAVFMAWLGSNEFSTEYEPDIWERVGGRYYEGTAPLARIHISIGKV